MCFAARGVIGVLVMAGKGVWAMGNWTGRADVHLGHPKGFIRS